MKFEIKHRFAATVLFSLETESLKLCVEAAVKSDADLRDANLGDADLRDANLGGADLGGAYLRGADLRGADLRDADLRDADLRDANLGGADLGGADLRDANLGDADLRGAYLGGANFDVEPATPERAIANLDKVREIILAEPDRLYMDHWHQDDNWKERTCVEELACNTTHCMAGWLQVCSDNPEIKKLEPNIAGVLLAPVASHMFYKSNEEVRSWLEKREYAQESAK